MPEEFGSYDATTGWNFIDAPLNNRFGEDGNAFRLRVASQ